jgi:L-lactate dehydrogenase
VRSEIAEGEAMDMRHGAAFYPHAAVGTAAVEEMRECDAVVVSAGRGGRPGQSRLELLRENAKIVTDIAKRLRGLRGMLVIVTNPVDVLTQIVTEAADLDPARVIGTGTMLDTARLREILGLELKIHPRSVHAQVVGEHGDSKVVLWSSATVGGRALRSFPGVGPELEGRVDEEVRCAAYEIIKRKGATNHAIGMVTAHLLKWMLRSERRILTVSRVQRGTCGVDGVALSLPAVVDARGATEVLAPDLSASERDALARSAEVLKEARRSIESA